MLSQKRESDISKCKARTAKVRFAASMAVSAGAANAAAKGASQAAGGGGAAEAVGMATQAMAAVQASAPPKRDESKDVEKWARGELEVEEAKEGIKHGWARAADILFILLIAGLIVISSSTPLQIIENPAMKKAMVVLVCFLFVFRVYLFQWIKQRVHIPEYIMDPWLLMDIGISALIILYIDNMIASLILILLTVSLTAFAPRIKAWYIERRKRKKIEKGEQIEEKRASLDERLNAVMKGAAMMDGVDFLLGWIPIAGDVIGFILNLRLPISAYSHKLIGFGGLVKMIIINIIDLALGSAGDALGYVGNIIDLFPSNIINQHLLKKEVARKKAGVSEGGSAGITMALIIIILGGVVAFVFLAAPRLAEFGGPLGEAMGAIAAVPAKMKAYFGEHNPVAFVRNYYKKQLLLATGDYYTGKVDENAKAMLGVYLGEIKQADPTFYIDRPATIFSTLTVQTLDEPVNVTIGCKSDKSKGGAVPQIYPKDKFVVDMYEEQDIDCMFKAGEIEKGTSTFTLSAGFNFKTMAYVKSYFMDQERLRSMRRDEIDPLEQYGIKEKEPTAIYTNGPVGIGMGVGKPPIGIDLQQPYSTMTLGITLENKWDGKITKINRFVVILPKGFNLQEIGATRTQVACNQLRENEISICSDELNNVYVVEDPTFVAVERGGFKSYRGFLRIEQADYEKVLGKITPVATQYFKAMIDYTYSLEKTRIVELKVPSTERASVGGDLVAGSGIDSTPPSISDFTVSKIDEASTQVSWKTSEPSLDTFKWWETSRPPNLGYPPIASSDDDTVFVTEHKRTLTGVIAGKDYGYEIKTIDGSGNSMIYGAGKTFRVQ